SGELIDACFNLLLLAAEIDGLAQERARDPRIGRRGADLVGLSARKSGGAERAAQSEALIDLRVDPQFGAVPEPRASIEGYVPGLTALVWVEAVLSSIGRPEREDILVKVGRLAVEGEAIELERGRPLAQKVTPAVVQTVLADLVVQSEPEG